MELWIRTQHKMALIKSNGIYFKEEHREYSDGSVVKWCFYDHKSDSVIATYKTKERCLEILDEIQKIMSSMSIFVKSVGELSNEDIERGLSLPVRTVCCNDTVYPLQALVYEMPKE